ncbi:MAG: complex I NDUFA9 subunit family protein [Nitrospirae bacterium]|nr:complex I NDUFA9 subunit family protein [Nitrospirota bacterium]
MIFIAGGTGFIGRHLIKTIQEKKISARCLVRDKERASLCKKQGFDTATGDVTDRESLKGCLSDIKMVVHLVGIIEEKGDMTFEKVHVEGTRNLVEEAKEAGVRHFFYQSALGASLSSWAKYHRTKAEAEEIVRTSGIPYTIFRPSLVIGQGDGFTEKIKELLSLGPVVPVPGSGDAKFQPIYVEDWVKCFLKIMDNPDVLNKVYEFGGPEYLTYNDMLKELMDSLGVKKPVVHLPIGFMKFGVPLIGGTKKIATLLGIKIPTVTLEQLRLLEVDNVCEIDSVEKNFGFKPLAYKDALKKFIHFPPENNYNI